jgi:Spy/CpxP family protein refolding chaperone
MHRFIVEKPCPANSAGASRARGDAPRVRRGRKRILKLFSLRFWYILISITIPCGYVWHTEEMKMEKRATIFYGILLAVCAMAIPLAAHARPFGCGPGFGPGGEWCLSLPQEQRDAVWKMEREYREKIQPIRDQLWIKSRMVDALSGNSRVEPKEIRSLVDEMAALRTQLRDAREAFADRVKQEAGVDMPLYGHGMGRGGYGRHYGGNDLRGNGDCCGGNYGGKGRW